MSKISDMPQTSAAPADVLPIVTPALANRKASVLSVVQAGRYVAPFSASSAQTISAATHGLGATGALRVVLYPGTQIVDAAVSVGADGTISWSADEPFSGQIVIEA